ncbi:MAG TPA: S8 family serine peptidase [Chitinophaga sp.]|uniref:S8 family serine peptidase n=1 Tax=Chitinophaga sp. TaxID=1869181 RepID=UPI002C3B2955|nr:S8 family serine peptidase [Chitinophaga sp.]HVI45129.1 S8 family serine peptidase [Chitinophaga sp.]
MKRKFLFPVILCLSIIGCTKNPQVTPAGTTENNEKTVITQGLKGQNHIAPGVGKYRLIVKFKAEEILGVEKTRPVFSNQGATARAEAWGSQKDGSKKNIYSFTYDQVMPFNPDEKAAMLQGRKAQPEPGAFDRYAFRGMMYVREAPDMSPGDVLNLANEFEKLDMVEYASLEPVTPPPPPVTPDFTWQQYYKNEADNSDVNVRGINAEYAWSIGVTGAGIRIADIEWGYNRNHEDLIGTTCQEVLPPPNDDFKDHGTAVAGILMGQKNNFGVTGMVYGADACYIVSERVRGRAGGIAEGLTRLRRGDVFLYEMQAWGENNYAPADYEQAVWDITKSATDAGIVVVAAAGNGNQNLDGAFYDSYRARGDNGAIIVGAGTKTARDKASFSTYGSVVHVQGWGDWKVTTSGGGADLFNGGPNAQYTNSFSGTSSASPIVTSAVVAVQSWYKARTGQVLAPRDIRDLLIRTGTSQGSGGHIGPLPNIKAAIVALGGPDNIDIVSGATYSIVAATNNTSLLDVEGGGAGDGTKVNLWTANAPLGNNQKWIVTSVGGGYYKLKPVHASAQALDVSNSGTADGTQVQIWNDNNTNAQKWLIKSVGGSGYYTLSPACAPASQLDINGSGTANGTKVQIWTTNTSNAQKFLFIRQ